MQNKNPSMGEYGYFLELLNVLYCIVLRCVALYYIVLLTVRGTSQDNLEMKHILFFFWQSKDPYKNGKLIFFQQPVKYFHLQNKKKMKETL